MLKEKHFFLFQDAFLRESEKVRDKKGRVSKKLQLKANAMPTIFPWSKIDGRQKTAGKTKDQVEMETEEANDLETELRRDALSNAGTGLHPGNSRFVCDGPIPGFEHLDEWDPFPDVPCDKPPNKAMFEFDKENVSNEYLLKKRIVELQQQLADKQVNEKLQQQKIDVQEKELSGVKKLFSQQQINVMAGIQTKPRYDDETVVKCNLIKSAAGTTVYEMMRELGFPFVSSSTIAQRSDLKYKPGVLKNHFRMLSVKARRKPELYKEACLVMDEMKIQEKFEVDPSDKTISGFASVPRSSNSKKEGDLSLPEENVARHGMVYMLVGVKARWKTVVGYDFTVGSFDGKTVADRIRYMIELAAKNGINVLELISDMGTSNLGV